MFSIKAFEGFKRRGNLKLLEKYPLGKLQSNLLGIANQNKSSFQSTFLKSCHFGSSKLEYV
jgi:hypothetical protein